MCGWEFMEVESNVSGLAFAAEWLQEKKGKNFTANETSYNMNYNNQVLRFSTRLFPLQTSLNFWDRRRETRITGLPSRKNLPSQEAKSFYVPPFFSTTRWEIQKTLHLTTSKELASWPGRFFLVYQQICSQKKRLNLWFQLLLWCRHEMASSLFVCQSNKENWGECCKNVQTWLAAGNWLSIKALFQPMRSNLTFLLHHF